MTPEILVLYSRLAFYPIHWQALEQIVARYRVRAVVLAAPAPELPSVHEAHGTAEPARGAIEVRRMPFGSRRERIAWLARQLREIKPDAVWVQEEPIDPFLLEILALYRLRRRPRIVASVCENIFPPPANRLERIARRALWPRLDELIAVAAPSVEGIRAGGMPHSVTATTLVAGGLEPPAQVEPLALPFVESDFVVAETLQRFGQRRGVAFRDQHAGLAHRVRQPAARRRHDRYPHGQSVQQRAAELFLPARRRQRRNG